MSAPQPARPAPSGRTVGASASVPARTRPATRPPGPACAPRAATGPAAASVSAGTELGRGWRGWRAGTRGALLWEAQPLTPGSRSPPLQGALPGASGLAVSTCADVSTAAPATRPWAPAAAPRGSWGPTAASVSGRGKAGAPPVLRWAGPPVYREDSALPTCLPGPPLGPRLGEQGVPAGCVLRAPHPRHAHQGGAQSPTGILPRTGPSPQSRGDSPPIWGPSGMPSGICLGCRLGLGGAVSHCHCRAGWAPAAPSGLGGARAGCGGRGAGSRQSPLCLGHTWMETPPCPPPRPHTVERGGRPPPPSSRSLSTRPIWRWLCPRLQLWAGGDLRPCDWHLHLPPREDRRPL